MSSRPSCIQSGAHLHARFAGAWLCALIFVLYLNWLCQSLVFWRQVQAAGEAVLAGASSAAHDAVPAGYSHP